MGEGREGAMIVAVHALMGAALARLCGTRAQALVVGGLSHLAADMLPHRDLDIAREALLLGGALGAVGLGWGAGSKEFAGALGAALPDVENLIGRALKVPEERMLLPMHGRHHGRLTAGFGGQVALALVCAAALLVPMCCEAGRRESSGG